MQRAFWIIALLCFCKLATVSAQHLSLRDALRFAKTQNPNLKTESHQISAAQADSITAALRPNPSFHNETIQLTQNRHFAANTAWSDPLNRQTLFTLTKPFQLAGQRQKKINLAQQQIDWSIKNYQELEREIFAEVASKWMDIYTAHKQLDILKIAKNNIDSLRDINEVRLKNQVITQTDFMRTQLLSKEYELKVKSAARELSNLLVELGYLIGSPVRDIDLSDQFALMGNLAVDSLLQKALLNRSDIKAAQSLMNVSNQNIALQKSLAVPVPEFGVMWNPQNRINYAGFTLTFDLPVFSRNQGEIRKALILKDQSEQQYEAVKNKAEAELTTAYASYQTQRQNTHQFTDSLLRQSEHILANVKYAYLRGGTTLIDFLEAQRSWLETQQQYYDAFQLYQQSYIQLLYASGLICQLAD
ncbi:TolC family protein [Olivibacter sp. XZL3]|uniref:TolC family protein n=1 Tax=Olivibacter sp. XZL3 TaxID=1735116 RepID=UPI0010654F61|nr:TolC family protein [Olivibacter sp. XZL3]